MADINREKLMQAMYHRAFETDGDTMWMSGCWVRYRAIEDVIKSQPTQSKRKKGLWVVETETDIKSGMIDMSGYRCNKCGYFVPWDYVHKGPFYIEEYKFCPNCGAPMDSDGNE